MAMTEAELRASLAEWQKRARHDNKKVHLWQKYRQRANAAVVKRKKQIASLENDAGKVIHWELEKVGVHETGFGNRGPEIDVWQREFGMIGQPWCALFQMYAIKHLGGITLPSDCAYTPNILNYARGKEHGFRGAYTWHEVELGDLVLFNFGSPDPVQHVGMYIGDGKTLEGNTSPGSGGSQDNGGGVYIRERGGSGVVACARLF